ncbi:hypothetical protein J2T57_001622 [Natronocella acetinitrilica]|uniref:ATP-grasp domain-containing protein n=1 Tax=Natronocella acetinitrilica TaxID=414046 RepID=A0AAE3G2G5_9GAMM|nr:ATP-grasp domain-containing protein [Natronocella acetinitrilica]MCP1674520.1 hypothetical protein [Natronocella acetinitrilica]
MWAMVESDQYGMGVESAAVYRHGLVTGKVVRGFRREQLAAGHLSIDRGALVVGGVATLVTVLERLGVTAPEPDYYPSALRNKLGRQVEKTTLGEAIQRAKKTRVFVKSHDWKVLTGCVIKGSTPEDGAGASLLVRPAEMPVWVAESVRFVAEYRVYVLGGEILAACVYEGDDALDDAPPVICMRTVEDAVAALAEAGDTRAGYAFDWGLLATGETVLVENNDGWAIGKYPGITDADYTALLHARWAQLTGGREEAAS